MATQVSGAVNEVVVADGPTQQPFRQGRNGEMLVTELHGKYLESARRGRVFAASQAPAGVLATVGTATTASACLANPPGSPKSLSLIRVEVVVKALPGTPIVGELATYVTPTPSLVAVTGTALTNLPGQVGAGAAPNGKAFTTATVPLAPIYHRPLATKLTGAATVMPFIPPFVLEFDGTCILPPGTYIVVGQDAGDTTNATIVVTFVWEEIDL